ncbi:MAG TPA: hypothetical protein VJL81_11175 [Solirubrobacterales bacterium]|nr:hypothetical protein [Solirubrobacterales bacterium]
MAKTKTYSATGAKIREMAADAAFDHRRGIAGIGVATPDQSSAVVRALAAPSTNTRNAEAQAVLAAIRALGAGAHRSGGGGTPRPAGSRVLTDNRGVVTAIYGAADDDNYDAAVRNIGADTLDLIREELTRFGYVVVHVDRVRVAGAHRAARMALNASRVGIGHAGRRRRRTVWAGARAPRLRRKLAPGSLAGLLGLAPGQPRPAGAAPLGADA